MPTSRQYRNEKWLKFRQDMIILAEYRCEECSKSESEGSTLQVHHRIYHSHLAAWEHSYSDCAVLCKGCHAKEHGKIVPSKGWSLESENDLGDLSGECELCGSDIRYEFTISHPLWHDLIVGTNCCDKLTESAVGTESRKRTEKLKRFCDSPLWSIDGGMQNRTYKNFAIGIIKMNDYYYLRINGKQGKREFISSVEAKKFVFSQIENGTLKQYFNKQ